YEAGHANAHDIHDPKDSRSLFGRANVEHKLQAGEKQRDKEWSHRDPTAPARDHGNRPSRGAEIDSKLQQDDELRLKEKGQA
ncbi:hypothetical protein BDY19DRAFT_880437, partial [Irpex rosettiformis]